eukprot:78382-Alexandrium_andersonii.AAC.1
MSASLVGSEMCIRDRFSGAPRVLSGAPRSFPDASGIFPSFPDVARRSPAVSYTHLTLPTICSV